MDKKKIHCRGGFFRVIGAAIIGIIVSALWSLVVGGLVLALWNWLMPQVFDLGVITYWQAFGLTLIFKLVLGGFGRPFMPPHGPGIADGRWREYAKHARFHKDLHREQAYEQWWEKEGAESFDRFIKNRDNGEENE